MAQAQGKIVQCIGAVVDVEFPRDQMPKVYDALKYEGGGLTLEVQQQLGDGVVRTIALGSSDGLRRGLTVVNTGAAITVPVGVDPGPHAHQGFDLDRPLREARDGFEKAYFEFHLAREGGSMTRVAEKTGLERTHLYRKLRQLGVDLGRGKRN